MRFIINRTKLRIDKFVNQCSVLERLIVNKKTDLIKLLSEYETHSTSIDEIGRAISTLDGARNEFSELNNPLSELTVTTFFPLNLPLYSLVLFAIMPSAFAKSVYVRPPEVMREMLEKLWVFLELEVLFPQISLKNVPRHIFLQLYAADSDVIIFTGKYENAIEIHKACPQTLMLYNGSGVNPILICDDADLKFSADKSVEMRCFNSGQDCAGPDAIFVPTDYVDEFIEYLTEKIKASEVVGDTKNPETTIGPTIKQSYISSLKDWLKDHKKMIVFGGEINEKQHLVHPTIVRSNVNNQIGKDFHEFFAPVFYILAYDNDDDLKKVLSSPTFSNRGMYISIFGNNPKIERTLKSVRILKNKIVNDVEQGNTEYGGYGKHANFTLWKGKKAVHPILISREINNLLKA